MQKKAHERVHRSIGLDSFPELEARYPCRFAAGTARNEVKRAGFVCKAIECSCHESDGGCPACAVRVIKFKRLSFADDHEYDRLRWVHRSRYAWRVCVTTLPTPGRMQRGQQRGPEDRRPRRREDTDGGEARWCARQRQ